MVPRWIQLLQSPYSTSDRANRCLRLPVGCTDSSFRYSRTPHSGGSGNTCRCVSDVRLASASTWAIAQACHSRSVGSVIAVMT